MAEDVIQNTNKSGRYVRNVVHHYIDPITGERKEKRFDDGPFEEVQAKINAFKKSLAKNAKDKTQ